MGDYFHVDSYYYMEVGAALLTDELTEVLSTTISNGLYVLLAALSQTVTDEVWPLVALNILFGSLIPVEAMKLVGAVGSNRHAQNSAGLFFACLPYQVHLSVHVLKEVLFLLLSLSMLRHAVERRFWMFGLMGVLALFVRLYLGAISLVAVLLGVVFGRYKIVGAVAIAVLLVSPVGQWFAEQLLERSEVAFEGREFFESVELGRPVSVPEMAGYAALSPVRQVFVPHVGQAQNAAELLFGVHALFYQLLFAAYLALVVRWSVQGRGYRHLLEKEKRHIWVGLIVVYLILIAFVDVTTPGVGPLVRYREWPMVVLGVSFFILLGARPRCGYGSWHRGETATDVGNKVGVSTQRNI
jgi:hypothetical protein